MENRRLSLGHKQLEENPWDVFETVFNLNSVHKGTILSINDKGAIVALPYGVEGFTPKRHLTKEDGSNPQVDESLDFMVIEFSKENKKIILSHNRIFQENVAAEKAQVKASKAANDKATSAAMKNANKNVEKTTLGDLGVLETLKAEMQESEKAKAEELLKKIEAKEDAKEEAKAEATAKEEAEASENASEEKK
jgi:small subunit ribosomal protein S1